MRRSHLSWNLDGHGDSFPSRRKSKCKGPGVRGAWLVLVGTHVWLEISKCQWKGRVWKEVYKLWLVFVFYSKNNGKPLESFKHVSIPSPRSCQPRPSPRLECESEFYHNCVTSEPQISHLSMGRQKPLQTALTRMRCSNAQSGRQEMLNPC